MLNKIYNTKKRNRIDGKKAQIVGQIFIYAIAVVVVGLIIVYGYSAIKGFRDRGEEVEYITFKTNIENSIKSIASDYGSIKRPDFRVPAKYEMVCFTDKNQIPSAAGAGGGLCVDDGSDDYYEPIACAGWRTGRYNVFLIPDGSEAFDAGDLKIKPTGEPFICVDAINGRLNLQLKGLGDKVQIDSYDPDEE